MVWLLVRTWRTVRHCRCPEVGSFSDYRVVAGLPTIVDAVETPPGSRPNEWQLRPEDSRSYHWDQLQAYDQEQERQQRELQAAAEYSAEGGDAAEEEENSEGSDENEEAEGAEGAEPLVEVCDEAESPLSWPSTPVRSVESCF